VSVGKYLGGLVDFGLGLIRGIDDPIFLPFRGLYFDGHDDYMRFVDFVFGGEASLGVVLRKPTASVGTLFSFDTAVSLNAELAISFEGLGNEIRLYYDGIDMKFNLGLTTGDWSVLGFNWSWNNGNMDFGLSIDLDTDILTLEGVKPYLDWGNSSHIWGNSRLTQFGLSRLFETFLNVYIHSIDIKNTIGLNWPPHIVLDGRIPGLWTCAWDAFFDEADGSCKLCDPACGLGCVRPGSDNCICYDIECNECTSTGPDADCLSCGLFTSFARGTATPCECKLGFSRDTANGA